MAVPDAISLSYAKSYLQIPAGVTEHDAVVGHIISAVSQHVAERLGLTAGLTINTYNLTLDVEDFGQDRLRCPVFPVQSVAALTNNGTAVAASDRYLKAERWIVLKGTDARFAEGKQKVQATVTAGWATVPTTVQLAVAASVAQSFNAIPKGGIAAERMGAYAVTMARNGGNPLSPEAAMMLSEYISPVTQR